MMRTKKLITPYFENNEFAGARVTLGDEDFVIAPKDYKQGNGMSWPDAMDALKKLIKEGLAEDMEKDFEDKVQKATDEQSKAVDALVSAKEKEVMTV